MQYDPDVSAVPLDILFFKDRDRFYEWYEKKENIAENIKSSQL